MHSHRQTRSIATPLVVKLGGSLHAHVPALAPILRSSPRPLLIVPGGGKYADAVREAGLDDETSHWKAIEAMDIYGRFVASFDLPVIDILAVPDHTSILLPSPCMHQYDPLPHSWDVTSDTIAAWVAATLHGELLLLKSVDGILQNGILQTEITAPLETDVTDPFLIPFALEQRVNTWIINGSHLETVARFLKGGGVIGTRISTIF